MADNGDAFKFAQDRFEDAYKQADRDARAVADEANNRRIAAYFFKLLAAIGGILIAAGVSGLWAQGIGIAVAIAIALDMVFANHERLLAVVAAKHAYDKTLRNIRHQHTLVLTPIQRGLDEGNTLAARSEAIAALTELTKLLFEDTEKIKEALHAADLKALKALAVEAVKDSK